MPLVGGGGSPNVSGAGSAAGVGTGLNYIGKHAYAYNNYAASTTSIARLNFTTGAEYIVGAFSLGPLINPTDTTDGKKSIVEIQFNSQTVATLNSDAAAQDQQTPQTINMLVPPYTHVEFKVKGQADSSSYTGTVGFTGRVYA
jgi:hypothetical protein